jgi:hypothetical protein
VTHRHRGGGRKGGRTTRGICVAFVGEFVRKQRQLADLSLRQMAELTQVSNADLSSTSGTCISSSTAIRMLVGSLPCAIPGGLTLAYVTST